MTDLINKNELKKIIAEVVVELIKEGKITHIDGQRVTLQAKQPTRRAVCKPVPQEREPVRDRVVRSLDQLSQRLSLQPFGDPFNGGPRF